MGKKVTTTGISKSKAGKSPKRKAPPKPKRGKGRIPGDRGRKDAMPGCKARKLDRAQKAFVLSQEGLTSRQIALRLGVSHVTILKDLNSVFQVIEAENLDRGRLIRERQLSDIEDVRARLLPFVRQEVQIIEEVSIGRGENKKIMRVPLAEWEKLARVTATLTRLYDREAKLVGADAPTKIEAQEKPALPQTPEDKAKAQELLKRWSNFAPRDIQGSEVDS